MITRTRTKHNSLRCPACRQDIGAFLAYEEVREWLKRQERRASLLRSRIAKQNRKKAAMMLRRLVAMESGKLIVESNGKLGLRELSAKIVELTGRRYIRQFCTVDPGMTMEQLEVEVVSEVEKLIVDYFTVESQTTLDPQSTPGSD